MRWVEQRGRAHSGASSCFLLIATDCILRTGGWLDAFDVDGSLPGASVRGLADCSGRDRYCVGHEADVTLTPRQVSEIRARGARCTHLGPSDGGPDAGGARGLGGVHCGRGHRVGRAPHHRVVLGVGVAGAADGLKVGLEPLHELGVVERAGLDELLHLDVLRARVLAGRRRPARDNAAPSRFLEPGMWGACPWAAAATPRAGGPGHRDGTGQGDGAEGRRPPPAQPRRSNDRITLLDRAEGSPTLSILSLSKARCRSL